MKEWYINKEHKPSLWITSGRGSALIEKHTKRESKILDCGCGSGDILRDLKNKNFSSLFGCDAEICDIVDIAQFKQVDFNFEKLPYADESMDLIFSFETLEHLENPRHFIREVYRVIKKDGTVIFSTPNISHIFNRITFLKNTEMYRFNLHNDHYSLFPKSIFEKTFLPYFVLEQTHYLKGEFPYRWFKNFKFSENRFFGRSVCWVFKKQI